MQCLQYPHWSIPLITLTRNTCAASRSLHCTFSRQPLFNPLHPLHLHLDLFCLFVLNMFKTINLQLLLFAALLTLSCGGSEHVAERGRWAEQHSSVWPAGPRINVYAENPSGNQSGEHGRVSKLEAYSLALNSTNLTQLAYGIAANVAAVLLYGTNFVPVKRIELGDGESLSLSLSHLKCIKVRR